MDIYDDEVFNLICQYVIETEEEWDRIDEELFTEGVEECLASNIGSLFAKGYSSKWIADVLEVPLSEVRKIIYSKRVILRDLSKVGGFNAPVIRNGQLKCLKRNVTLLARKGYTSEWIADALEVSKDKISDIIDSIIIDGKEYVEPFLKMGFRNTEWFVNMFGVSLEYVEEVMCNLGIEEDDE